jgi:hypothetical protein
VDAAECLLDAMQVRSARSNAHRLHQFSERKLDWVCKRKPLLGLHQPKQTHVDFTSELAWVDIIAVTGNAVLEVIGLVVKSRASANE